MNNHLLKFVEDFLKSKNLHLVQITEHVINDRLSEIMDFVNEIITENALQYNWTPLNEEYFLNPLVDKFRFSYLIQDTNNKICFFNFTSIYNQDTLHNHCTYVGKKFRGLNLAKIHMLFLCCIADEAGITKHEGYWPKSNNGSIVLFLKMGWQIDDLRKNGTQLFLVGDNSIIKTQVTRMLNVN